MYIERDDPKMRIISLSAGISLVIFILVGVLLAIGEVLRRLWHKWVMTKKIESLLATAEVDSHDTDEDDEEAGHSRPVHKRRSAEDDDDEIADKGEDMDKDQDADDEDDDEDGEQGEDGKIMETGTRKQPKSQHMRERGYAGPYCYAATKVIASGHMGGENYYYAQRDGDDDCNNNAPHRHAAATARTTTVRVS